MSHTYGQVPRLVASDPAEGATLDEMAAWIERLRADGAPGDAPIVAVRTNLRAGIKRAEIATGDRLAASLKRRAERRASTDHTPLKPPRGRETS